MTPFERQLVENVRAHKSRAIADIFLCRPEKDGSKRDKEVVDFVRIMDRIEMMLTITIKEIENAAEIFVISPDVVGRIAEDVVRSDQLMMLIAVFVVDQKYHDVQIRLAERTLLRC